MNDASLDSSLATIGKACFVKYYNHFIDDQYSNTDIAELLRDVEKYSEKSCSVRVSGSRKIIRDGFAKKALNKIAFNSQVDIGTIELAKKLINNTLSTLEKEVYVFNAGHNNKKSLAVRKSSSENTVVNLKHNDIQEKLYKALCDQFGCSEVATELLISGKRRIDAVVRLSEISYKLFEIKTASTLSICIREALGQLLEYAHLNSFIKASEFVVVAHHDEQDEVNNYLKTLNELYGFKVSYMQVV